MWPRCGLVVAIPQYKVGTVPAAASKAAGGRGSYRRPDAGRRHWARTSDWLVGDFRLACRFVCGTAGESHEDRTLILSRSRYRLSGLVLRGTVLARRRETALTPAQRRERVRTSSAIAARPSSPTRTRSRRIGPRSSWAPTATRSTSAAPRTACWSAFTTTCSTASWRPTATWAITPGRELQQFRFRNPGRFGEQCRIPTLDEVFELHRKHGGLMHLDIKRPNLDEAIIELLDEAGPVGPRRLLQHARPAA